MDIESDNNGIPFSSPDMGSIAALAEALRQLLDARQEKLAIRLLDQCDRPLAQKIIHLPLAEHHVRLRCLVRTRLRRRLERCHHSMQNVSLALVGILNLWCREGRRQAIRCVLYELDGVDRMALAANKELDVEVASMLRELGP